MTAEVEPPVIRGGTSALSASEQEVMAAEVDAPVGEWENELPRAGFDYSTSPSSQWKLVALLTAIGALSTIDRQILALLVEPLKADLQLTDVQIGILQGAGIAVTGFLIGPIAGIMADRYCRRCMIGTSALLWSILTAVCGLSGSYAMLLFARAGIGLFEGVHLPTATSMLRDGLSVERRGRGFATMSMGNLGGVGLAMIGGGMLIAFFQSSLFQSIPVLGEIRPWRLVFLCFGLIGVPVALLMLLVKEPMRGGPDKSGAAVGAGLSEAWRHIVEHWRIYLPLMLFSAMHGMLGLSFAAWIPAMLQRTWGLSIPQIGLTFGLLMLFLAPVGLWLTGAAMDRLNLRSPAGSAIVGLVVTAIIGVVATSMPIAPSPLLFWALFACLTLISGAAYPVTNVILSTITPSRALGKVFALQGLIAGILVAVVAPSLVPIVASLYSEPKALNFALSTLVGTYSFIALLAIAALIRPMHRWAAGDDGD
jgi:MFS family permease